MRSGHRGIRAIGARLAAACCLALCASAAAGPITWDAGLDLIANEQPNGNPTELFNPNPQNGGAWSYGYRAAVASTALTLFSGAGDHTNAFAGTPNVEGWLIPNSFIVRAAVVNTSGATIPSLSYGAGPLLAGEMLVHPGDLGQTPGVGPFTVVRWTAPANGAYAISAHWRDIHLTGNGEDVYIVLNGTALFSSVTLDGGPDVATAMSLVLSGGSTLDFLTGPNGDFGSDSTAFNAVVTQIPEPATLTLLALGGLALLRRRRRP